MKVALSINGIIFDYPLFVSSEFSKNNWIGNREFAINGKLITNYIEKGNLSKEVALFSFEYRWISTATKNKLMKDIDANQKIVVFDDGTSEKFYYKLDNPIEIEPLYEGSDWHKVKINLIKGE